MVKDEYLFKQKLLLMMQFKVLIVKLRKGHYEIEGNDKTVLH